MPPSLETNRKVSRVFIWNIVHSLKPGYVSSIVATAQKNRLTFKEEEEEPEAIEVHADWVEKL